MAASLSTNQTQVGTKDPSWNESFALDNLVLKDGCALQVTCAAAGTSRCLRPLLSCAEKLQLLTSTKCLSHFKGRGWEG